VGTFNPSDHPRGAAGKFANKPAPPRSTSTTTALRSTAAASRTATSSFEEVASSFQKRPCYRYLRASDRIPTRDELGDTPFAEIPVKVRLFDPSGAGTWWVCAYDPDTRVAWGAAEIFEREVGSFSMDEIVSYRDRFGLPIERDLYFDGATLADVVAGGGN
jgi:regulator of protease activity HflC (stomatin/prohibitin superfamily)